MKIVDTMAKRPLRRKYSDQLKLQVVQECRRRGASVAGVALSHGINANIVQGVFGSYDARTTLHARLAWHATPQVRVAVSVENAGNKQYFDFYKQAGAAAFAEVAVKF